MPPCQDRTFCRYHGSMVNKAPVRRPSEARERLLRTASGIFYAKGINSVGVEEIISRAQVTRATFYRHFPSKDDLIVAYLDSTDAQIRQQLETIVARGQSAQETIRAIAEWIVDSINDPHFRGCAFLNAAAEYPDASSPVQQAVLRHRDWFKHVVQDQLERLRGEPSDAGAQFFVMIRDGAMAAGALADRKAVCAAFLRGVEAMLAYRPIVEGDTRAPAPAKRTRRSARPARGAAAR